MAVHVRWLFSLPPTVYWSMPSWKICLQKVLILKKSRAKIPLVIGGSRSRSVSPKMNFSSPSTLISVLLVHLSLSILITKCKIITGEFQKAYIYFVPFDSIHFRTVCLWKLLMLTTGVVFHDAIYQFLRIFYHSRFKPDNLQMTLVQWAMPIVDLVFLVGPLLHIKRWQ